MDARPHRLSDRRRGNAAALGDGLDAQSRADDRRQLPHQASADRLAARRTLVLGHAGRRRLRQQQHELAMGGGDRCGFRTLLRSDEHTSELQSLMRITYAVFCLKKKKHTYEHVYIRKITREITNKRI